MVRGGFVWITLQQTLFILRYGVYEIVNTLEILLIVREHNTSGSRMSYLQSAEYVYNTALVKSIQLYMTKRQFDNL